MFIHDCETCCGHSSNVFARRVGEVAILSIIYESMGHKERNIWSQERMSRFVECLLL